MALRGSVSTGVRLLILLASMVTPAQAASKLVVDDDRRQCPQAGFTTIQSAIDSLGSNATGTITVCAGTYTESITVAVAHELKLVGKRGAVIIPEFTPNHSTLISVQFSTDVTIKGFTIDGLGNDGTADAGGAVALEFLHSSGTIQNNTIRNWHTLNFAATANGLNAIHLINGQGESVNVIDNTITDFQTNAILAEGSSTLKISGNDITTRSTPANTATGIFVQSTGSGAPSGSITSNTLSSDSFPGGSSSIGIRMSESGNFLISHNKLPTGTSGCTCRASVRPLHTPTTTGSPATPSRRRASASRSSRSVSRVTLLPTATASPGTGSRTLLLWATPPSSSGRAVPTHRDRRRTSS